MKETKVKLDKYYGESVPLIRTVYKWFSYFQSDHMNTNDAECSRWPFEVTTAEILEKSMIW